MAKQDDFIRTALRVPPDLHKQLHEAASAAGRTFNAEIVARLTQSFERVHTSHVQAGPTEVDWQLRVELRTAELRQETTRSQLFVIEAMVDRLGTELQVANATEDMPIPLPVLQARLESAMAERDRLRMLHKEQVAEQWRLQHLVDAAVKPVIEHLDDVADEKNQSHYQAIKDSEDALGVPSAVRTIVPNKRAGRKPKS